MEYAHYYQKQNMKTICFFLSKGTVFFNATAASVASFMVKKKIMLKLYQVFTIYFCQKENYIRFNHFIMFFKSVKGVKKVSHRVKPSTI